MMVTGSDMSMYVMTGVHGSHVLIGLIALSATLIQSSSNALYRGAPLPIQSGTEINRFVIP